MMRPGWNKFHPNCSDRTCQARPGRCVALGLCGSAPRDKGQQQDHYMLHRSPIHQKFHTNRPPRMVEELLDPLYLISLLVCKLRSCLFLGMQNNRTTSTRGCTSKQVNREGTFSPILSSYWLQSLQEKGTNGDRDSQISYSSTQPHNNAMGSEPAKGHWGTFQGLMRSISRGLDWPSPDFTTETAQLFLSFELGVAHHHSCRAQRQQDRTVLQILFCNSPPRPF